MNEVILKNRSYNEIEDNYLKDGWRLLSVKELLKRKFQLNAESTYMTDIIYEDTDLHDRVVCISKVVDNGYYSKRYLDYGRRNTQMTVILVK